MLTVAAALISSAPVLARALTVWGSLTAGGAGRYAEVAVSSSTSTSKLKGKQLDNKAGVVSKVQETQLHNKRMLMRHLRVLSVVQRMQLLLSQRSEKI